MQQQVHSQHQDCNQGILVVLAVQRCKQLACLGPIFSIGCHMPAPGSCVATACGICTSMDPARHQPKLHRSCKSSSRTWGLTKRRFDNAFGMLAHPNRSYNAYSNWIGRSSHQTMHARHLLVTKGGVCSKVEASVTFLHGRLCSQQVARLQVYNDTSCTS